MWHKAVLISASLLLLACQNDAQRYLSVAAARVERGEGIAVGGGLLIGHSVLVAGSLTNRHPSQSALNIHLEVKLFRKAGDKKPARIYEEYSIQGLERVAPGKAASFRHYVKSSIDGYETCEIRPLSADFR